MMSRMTESDDGNAGGRLFPRDRGGVDPVAAVLLADACRAIAAYPETIPVGPLFTAAERVADGWQVVCPCDPLPQGARELLADHLEDTAGHDASARSAVRLLRREPVGRAAVDEVRTAGRRFRVIRIEQLVRTGPDGPEPPRPTDFDPRPGDDRLPRHRPYDLIADGRCAPDPATLGPVWGPPGGGPAGPFWTPVQLAPAFTVAERPDGRWRPVGRLHDTPQQARDSLATYFRHVVPAIERPGETELAEYERAAVLMEDATRRNGIAVAGRRFRIVRLERLAMIGPDGPEPPRPSDPDPR
jgi:hypothetical protein